MLNHHFYQAVLSFLGMIILGIVSIGLLYIVDQVRVGSTAQTTFVCDSPDTNIFPFSSGVEPLNGVVDEVRLLCHLRKLLLNLIVPSVAEGTFLELSVFASVIFKYIKMIKTIEQQ